MTKVYDTATDIITFARSSSGTALRRVGYGDELVTNGGFDTDTDWVKATGWTIGSGVASANIASGFNDIDQAISVTAGKLFTIELSITSVTSGSMSVFLGNSGNALANIPTLSNLNTSGDYQGYIVFDGSQTQQILIRAQNGFVGSIDNVSVKEVIFDRPSDDLVLFDHPDDIPRIEYGSDGSVKGLLIEEQRTNLVTYSEDNSQWYTAASASLSDGTDGFTLGTTASGFNNSRFATPFITMTDGQILTASWEIDTSQSDDITDSDFELYIGRSGSNRLRQVIQISGNTVTQGTPFSGVGYFEVPSSGSSTTPVQTGPTTWRISITAENVTGADETAVVCGFWDRSTTLSRTIAVRNPQIEEGSFPTSYIPTSNGQSTRSADIASIPVSAFGYNQDAGTVVAEYMLYNTAFSATRTLAQLDDGTTSNRLVSQVSTGGKSRLYMAAAGSPQDSFGAEDVLEGVANKTAVSFVENSNGISTNGSATENGDGTSVVPSVTTLRLGLHSNGNFPLNGHIKSIQYYPRRLTDAQLQELTA